MSRERADAARGGPVTPSKRPLADADQAATLMRQRYMPPVVQTITPDEIRHAERASTKMLLALAATSRHLYGGTVSGAEKAKRRARGKRARAARKAGR